MYKKKILHLSLTKSIGGIASFQKRFTIDCSVIQEDKKMEFNFASRLDSFEEGIFATLNDKKNELVKAGRKVYNMSVGTPDFKPAQHIMDAVSEAASKPENYKYALADLPELLDAVSNHYAERYGVKGIRHEEIMSIYGSQEGMAHIAMAICDPGDVVLVKGSHGMHMEQVVDAFLTVEKKEDK